LGISKCKTFISAKTFHQLHLYQKEDKIENINGGASLGQGGPLPPSTPDFLEKIFVILCLIFKY
jgi:hypothetical protein